MSSSTFLFISTSLFSEDLISDSRFEKLTSFKQTDSSEKTPQQRLVEYCSQVLGAIERRHVDFKQKHDRRDAKLAEDDKKNLKFEEFSQSLI